jgi:hypothetical protein
MESNKGKSKMIKKFLVVLVAFVTVFLTQSQTWAAVQNADKVQQAITVDKSTFFTQESPAMLAMKMGKGGDNSVLWIASIFIAGLGQILMGDLWRGLKFLLLEIGLAVVSAVIIPILITAGGAAGVATGFGIAGILGLVIWVAILAVHIWNIIDAYNMSQEGGGMSKLNENQMARLQEELKAATEFANNIKVSDNGSVSVRALAF